MKEDKKMYDLTVLLKKDNESTVKNIVKDSGGSNVSDIRPFSKVTLAYPVKGETYAFMLVISFEADEDSLKSVEEKLGAEENVLRYLVVNLEMGNKRSEEKRRPEKKELAVKEKKSFVSNEALEEKIKEISE